MNFLEGRYEVPFFLTDTGELVDCTGLGHYAWLLKDQGLPYENAVDNPFAVDIQQYLRVMQRGWLRGRYTNINITELSLGTLDHAHLKAQKDFLIGLIMSWGIKKLAIDVMKNSYVLDITEPEDYDHAYKFLSTGRAHPSIKHFENSAAKFLKVP